MYKHPTRCIVYCFFIYLFYCVYIVLHFYCFIKTHIYFRLLKTNISRFYVTQYFLIKKDLYFSGKIRPCQNLLFSRYLSCSSQPYVVAVIFFSNYFKFAPEIHSLLFLCTAFRESAISADFHRSLIRHRRDNNYQFYKTKTVFRIIPI